MTIDNKPSPEDFNKVNIVSEQGNLVLKDIQDCKNTLLNLREKNKEVLTSNKDKRASISRILPEDKTNCLIKTILLDDIVTKIQQALNGIGLLVSSNHVNSALIAFIRDHHNNGTHEEFPCFFHRTHCRVDYYEKYFNIFHKYLKDTLAVMETTHFHDYCCHCRYRECSNYKIYLKIADTSNELFYPNIINTVRKYIPKTCLDRQIDGNVSVIGSPLLAELIINYIECGEEAKPSIEEELKSLYGDNYHGILTALDKGLRSVVADIEVNKRDIAHVRLNHYALIIELNKVAK